MANVTFLGICYIFTVRKRSCGKVMFSHLSVILFTGGGGACVAGGIMAGGTCMVGSGRFGVAEGMRHEGMHGRGRCAWQERRPLQRTVRILLECLLVSVMFFSDRDFIFDCRTVFDHMRRKSKNCPTVKI